MAAHIIGSEAADQRSVLNGWSVYLMRDHVARLGSRSEAGPAYHHRTLAGYPCVLTYGCQRALLGFPWHFTSTLLCL
jgi:hypothetical protein